MTDTARVRISKVRFHDGRELVILTTPEAHPETRFTEILVEMLARVRKGEVLAYAASFVLRGDENEPGDRLSCWGVVEDAHKTELIGVLEVLQAKIAYDAVFNGDWERPLPVA